MYTSTERDPVIGDREHEVHDCKTCDGSGLAPWHLGCGDSGPPECRTCDGVGQYIKRWRWVYLNNEYSDWQYSDYE